MEYAIAYLLTNVAVGAVVCLFGRRLFFVALGLLTFLYVINIGSGGSAASVAVAVVLGVLAALLSKFAYRAAVFVVGMLAGAALGFVLGTLLLPVEAADYLGVLSLVAGVVVGLLATRFSDTAVRLGTAWSGASLAAPCLLAAALALGRLAELAVPGDAAASFDALGAYVNGPFMAAYSLPVLVATVVLAVVGFVVQGRHK